MIDQEHNVLYSTDMTKILHSVKTRNWVAKHNQNPAVRHRDRTDYQRRAKHQARTQQKELQDAT